MKGFCSVAHGCLNAFANAKGTVFSIHHAEAASLIFFFKKKIYCIYRSYERFAWADWISAKCFVVCGIVSVLKAFSMKLNNSSWFLNEWHIKHNREVCSQRRRCPVWSKMKKKNLSYIYSKLEKLCEMNHEYLILICPSLVWVFEFFFFLLV